MSDLLRYYIDAFRKGISVGPGGSDALFSEIVGITDEEMLEKFLTAWEEKGVTDNELLSMARIMRSRMTKIVGSPNAVDIVGTGGSSSKTFNVSTAAAFVSAGAGVPIAKHGNRAATSNTGSADVLGELGVTVDVSPEISARCLSELGICFMFAPRFHSLSPSLAAARRRIKRPTIFNNLGPLCNPAGASYQLIGVSNVDWVDRTAKALSSLGATRSWVVNGANGLDEIALNGPTRVAEVTDGQIKSFEINASDFGLSLDCGPVPTVKNAAESAGIIRSVLTGRLAGQPAENIVAVNAAAAVYLSGVAGDLKMAFEMARTSIKSGAAMEKLEILAAETKQED